MPKTIIVNAVTLEGANIVPLLTKMEWYRKNGFSVTFFGNRRLKERIDE